MRRLAALAVVVVAAAFFVSQVVASHTAQAKHAFTPAPHRAEPHLTSHGFTLKPLRVISILAVTGKSELEDAASVQTRLCWFSSAVTHGLWYHAMAADYHSMGPGGMGSCLFTTNSTALKVGSGSTNGGFQDLVFKLATNKDVVRDKSVETIYLLYLDCNPNVTFAFGDCNTGWHRSVDLTGSRSAQSRIFSPNDSLAFVTGDGKVKSTDLDMMTQTASHEVIEAGSHPKGGIGGSGWYIPSKNPPWNGSPWAELQDGDPGTALIEVADMGRTYGQHIRLRFTCPPQHPKVACQSGTATAPEGSYSFDRVYSPSKAQANGDPDVPPTPVPYYSSTTPKDWYQLSTNGKATIPVKAWSVTDSEPWTLFGNQLAGPGKCTLSGIPAKVKNGTVVSVDVKMSKPRKKNSWCVFELKSHRKGNESPAAKPDGGGDLYHSWVVGVYYLG